MVSLYQWCECECVTSHLIKKKKKGVRYYISFSINELALLYIWLAHVLYCQLFQNIFYSCTFVKRWNLCVSHGIEIMTSPLQSVFSKMSSNTAFTPSSPLSVSAPWRGRAAQNPATSMWTAFIHSFKYNPQYISHVNGHFTNKNNDFCIIFSYRFHKPSQGKWQALISPSVKLGPAWVRWLYLGYGFGSAALLITCMLK